jgi:hypothetical protein
VEARSSTFARKFSGTTRFEPAAAAEVSAADAPMFVPEIDAANPFKPVTSAGPPTAVDAAPEAAETPASELANEPAADVEPVAESVAKLEPEPVPEPEAAIQPIDVSELDKPELAESGNLDSVIAPWMMAAGAGVFLVLALLIWLLLRKRKNADEIDAKTDAEAEVEAEAPAPAPEVAAVPVITDIDEPENVPELSLDDLIEPVPELEPLDDEFGLDDYDLSEFDDLPGAEVEKDAEKDTGSEPENTPDNNRNKELTGPRI